MRQAPFTMHCMHQLTNPICQTNFLLYFIRAVNFIIFTAGELKMSDTCASKVNNNRKIFENNNESKEKKQMPPFGRMLPINIIYDYE